MLLRQWFSWNNLKKKLRVDALTEVSSPDVFHQFSADVIHHCKFPVSPARSTTALSDKFWNVWHIISTQRCRYTDFSFDISTHSCSAKLLTDRHLKGSTWSDLFVISLVVTAWSFMNIWKRNKNILYMGGETFSFVFSYRYLIFSFFVTQSHLKASCD